jgi:hypothetical protein
MQSSCKHHNAVSYPHNKKDGRGIIGAHWECKKVGCEFNNDAWLYDSIVGDCFIHCPDCGLSRHYRGQYKGINITNWLASGP